MKVYIGKYRSGIYWFNKLQDLWLTKTHGKKWGWEVDEKDYTALDRIVTKTLDACQIALTQTIGRWIENQPRKIKVKIHHYDVWSADHTLSLIIVPVLKLLRDVKHGSPLVDDEDVPDELKSTNAEPKENDWDTDSNHHKRWDYVLDEMIWAFEQIKNSEGWFDGTMEERQTKQERMQKGLILFGKYYQALWD